MPQYRLRVHATATIEENWIAEGTDAEVAFENVLQGQGHIEDDKVIGDETDRQLAGWTQLPVIASQPTATPRDDRFERMLVLSTAHITQATCNEWLAQATIPAWPKGEYGWFVYATEEIGDAPTDMEAVIHYAREANCDWIMLDRDAATIDDPRIPTFDW